MSDDANARSSRRAPREAARARGATACRRSPTGSSARHTPPRRWRAYRRRHGRRGPARARSPAGSSAWRSQGKTTFAHLEDDSGRIQLYFRQDQLGDGVRAARPARPRRPRRRATARCSGRERVRSPCGRRTVRAARQVAPAAAVRQGSSRRRRGRSRVTRRAPATPSSATGSATPTSPCIPRCARVFRLALERDQLDPRASSTSAAFSRSRRRCCSRCTAARRRGRS